MNRSIPFRLGAPAPERLLAWYDVHRRDLPWRAKPGERSDPYRVWLSEIMLQQTTVAAVGPHYHKFLDRWSTVEALAAAPLDEVLGAWAGLGYYARARNLHRAAQIVSAEHNGKFPDDIQGLRNLPGIGAYTAGAIAAIAFDRREIAVDANAERVLARYFAVQEALPKARAQLGQLAQSLLPPTRPGDFAQALMDLGALICTPKSPSCRKCPWAEDCQAYRRNMAQLLPRKVQKRPRPVRRGAAFVAWDRRGRVLLEKRPDQGLLGGMLQPPMTAWGESFPTEESALREVPFMATWRKHLGIVQHGFTHFELQIEVYSAVVSGKSAGKRRWVAPAELPRLALPTVMRKILEHATNSLEYL